MDEYPDLVARLREKAAEVNGFGADIFDEAADRILELERESKRPKPGFADGYSLALIQAASIADTVEWPANTNPPGAWVGGVNWWSIQVAAKIRALKYAPDGLCSAQATAQGVSDRPHPEQITDQGET